MRVNCLPADEDVGTIPLWSIIVLTMSDPMRALNQLQGQDPMVMCRARMEPLTLLYHLTGSRTFSSTLT